MIGKQIGAYRLLKLLGAGGMGRVFLCQHVVMGDQWAVKVLFDEFAAKPEILARFVDEARAAARVRHPNLVRVFHVDRTTEGTCYMVLEYLDGASLAKRITTRLAPMDAVIRIGGQIASALQQIHKHGIVHRDIKPDNIMLIHRDGDPEFPVVLDLGVAHLGKGLATGPGTQSGLLVGTPSYMAPEHLLGEPVDASADMFSLAVSLYELATGRLPWQHAGESRSQYANLTPAEIYRRQQTEGAVDPRRYVAAMSDAFAKALLAPLAVDPAKRPKNVREYLLSLAEACPGDDVNPDGLQVLRDYAPDLLTVEDARETIRAAAPAILSTSGHDANYKLGELLGSGGMAEVFSAHTLGVSGFERRVAIKRVLPHLLAQPGFADMFVAEARTAVRLTHPNIVTVVDLRKDDEGRLFLVMDYIDGVDLARLDESGQLPISAIIYIAIEMLRGLGHAHSCVDPVNNSRGVVHRDVSPHNVLLSRAGEVKLTDFGLARAMDAFGRAMSDTVRGKPSYMSPEQLRGHEMDARSDLFAVGIILWELCTHKPLFAGHSSEEIISGVYFKDIEPASKYNASVPADLEAIIMSLLERDANARYPTAEAVISELVRCPHARLDTRDELIQLIRDRFPRPGEKRRTISIRNVEATGSKGPITSPATPSTPVAATPPATEPVARTRVFVVGTLASLAAIVGGFVVTWWIVSHKPHAVPVAAVEEHDARQEHDDRATAPSPDAADTAVADTLRSAPIDAGASIDAQAGSSVPVDAQVNHGGSASHGTETHVHHDAQPTGPPGEIAIIVSQAGAPSWAKVFIDGKRMHDTPYREPSPPGRHRLRLVNEIVGKDESVTVTVESGKTTTIERTWQ